MREKETCRICTNYSYDRDNEADIFHCKEGYFSYIDWGEGDRHGKVPKKSSVTSDPPPCDWEQFVVNKNSKWYFRKMC